ncbi:MAG: dihydrofolate reductase family protein [bacterium]
MRRIVMFDRVSADGYFSAPDGNLNWTVPDDEIDKSGTESMPDSDAMLFGRKTYKQFESFWPNVLSTSGTAPDPHAAGRNSPALHAMAVWINDATKIVFSKTLQDVTWKNSRLIKEFDPRVVEAIKNEPGKDIMIFGSGTIVSELTRHGLIDEYHFVVSPTLLGEGKTLISGVPLKQLALLEAKPYTSGNVVLRYGLKSAK